MILYLIIIIITSLSLRCNIQVFEKSKIPLELKSLTTLEAKHFLLEIVQGNY